MSMLDKVEDAYLVFRYEHPGQHPHVLYVTEAGKQCLLEEIREEFRRVAGDDIVGPCWVGDGLFGMEIHVLADDEVAAC